MKFLLFLKNNLLFQNIASWILSKIPPFVEHNIGKYSALRKAFYLTALEQLEGDYLEFGVFTGSSFVFACRFGKKMQAIYDGSTKYFGFDSFEGFGVMEDHDKHPFYRNETFAVNEKKVVQNIFSKTKGMPVQLIKGYFNQSLKENSLKKLGIQKARIIFIDCDLKDPAKDVFDYVRPILQKGTILIMDDFFSYKGDLELGLSGAFEDFKRANPTVKWRRLLDYGYGGIAYICSQT